MTAMHIGINALSEGDCDTTLISGISMLYPQEGGYIAFLDQVFSASGVYRPLDARGDGYNHETC
jgi:acyl transferase domain-containing protein